MIVLLALCRTCKVLHWRENGPGQARLSLVCAAQEAGCTPIVLGFVCISCWVLVTLHLTTFPWEQFRYTNPVSRMLLYTKIHASTLLGPF
jgi:hypothetical protein